MRRTHPPRVLTILTATAVVAATVVAGQSVPHAAVAAGPAVAINELHYNPADDNPAAEYVELFNPGPAPIDLSGWCIGGISFCFQAGASIAAGQYLVVAGLLYTGALSNGGERITLTDAAKVTIDTLTYDDVGAWPALADGDGHSLQRRDITLAANKPGNWMSAPPTPGAPNSVAAAGLLPSFSNVTHTVLPAAGAPIQVTAKLADAATATLLYTIGVGGSETAVEMTVGSGTATAAIPGQPAGALVRYRLTATTDGRTGTWPRQGDGSTYAGTTVARSAPSALPAFEIFMADATYAAMVADLTLSGDNGYPMVFAYQGIVFDGAKIRVKGQVSRSFPKKKFKVILPAGHVLEADLFPEPVDEFGLHSSWSDRSFLRETLASEFMVAADARGAQQAFPVRVERNGAFYGLYSYVEQPDGSWRDRYALDDSEVYEVGPDNIFGTLDASDAGRSQTSLRARYDKETFEYADDASLRQFIATVNSLSGPRERDWIYANVDVASVVNGLAAAMVMQHQDWGHKNYRLVFDQHGRVGITQNDFDLSFGRRWSSTRGALDTDVYVGGAFEHPGGPFFETFFFDPLLSQLVERRVRTLTEELLNPAVLTPRIQALAAYVRPVALDDRFVWGTYGGSADPSGEANRIIDEFVRPQFSRLLGAFVGQGRVAATSQPAVPAVSFSAVGYSAPEIVAVRNDSGDTVDLSGFEIPELEYVIPGGTVLLPGQQAVFHHEDVTITAGTFPGALVGGYFGESLADAPDGISLRNRAGTVVARHTLLPPGSITELHAQPNRSALVSIVATETGQPGYLQLMPCDDEPGATSNLNVDGSGQTRSTLGLARFDADGTTCLYNLGAAHVVADLQGYFAAGAVDDVDDERLIDTRDGSKPVAGAVIKVSGGRPDTTGIVGLVATEPDAPGYFSIIDCTNPALPAQTSNLNYDLVGKTIAGLAFARFDATGSICVYTLSSAHLVVDVQGYLAATAFDDTPDQRLADTRPLDAPPSLLTITGRPNSTGVVSIVATEASGPGFLQVLACPDAPGATSNVNYDRPGATVNGLATVAFDGNGTACIYARTPTEIVVDLQGYFAAGAFDDVPDQRLTDSRQR